MTRTTGIVGWRFDNTYARLPEVLFSPATPAPVPAPRVVVLNHRLAGELGLDFTRISPEDAAALFAGQAVPEGAEPIAQAYAGHQFGHFTMLGDGRAILVGEHRTPDGSRVDVQFKGSGRTRFSRGGDGKAGLGPMLREYVISEALAALGVPTTRSLAVVSTGEPVHRATPLKGAVLTRVAASHVRVGTFEYVAARRDEAVLKLLADYTIARHYPDLTDDPAKYGAFLRAVLDRQATLVARWQLVGFIHGVMNTDNMAISGETIDFGPCAFMNAYDPGTVYSSIDRAGRYAYGNQPGIAQWNLARFGEALLPLLDPDESKAIAVATDILSEFPDRFAGYWLAGMRRKLGLLTAEPGDVGLIQALLDWMAKTRADFTNTFRDLSAEAAPAGEVYRDPVFQTWYSDWRERLARDRRSVATTVAGMRAVNPAVIPRNHRVEETLAAAEDRDDLSVLNDLLGVLENPYEEDALMSKYRDPPADETGYRTFCGT